MPKSYHGSSDEDGDNQLRPPAKVSSKYVASTPPTTPARDPPSETRVGEPEAETATIAASIATAAAQTVLDAEDGRREDSMGNTEWQFGSNSMRAALPPGLQKAQQARPTASEAAAATAPTGGSSSMRTTPAPTAHTHTPHKLSRKLSNRLMRSVDGELNDSLERTLGQSLVDKKQKFLECLRSKHMLAGMSREDVGRLVLGIESKTFERGANVIEIGDSSTEVCLRLRPPSSRGCCGTELSNQ